MGSVYQEAQAIMPVILSAKTLTLLQPKALNAEVQLAQS